MASPVAVIVNPNEAGDHCLFWLNGQQQLALEHRSEVKPTSWDEYINYGVSTGVIVNPASLGVVLHAGLLTVYGITQPKLNGDMNQYVSQVSPIFNPLTKDSTSVTTQPGLAACSNQTGTDYVYYLQLPSGGSSYQLAEAIVVGNSGATVSVWPGATPSKNTNLASVFFPATQERFIFFSNTDKKHQIYWVGSQTQAQSPIPGTAGVVNSSPLAVCSVPAKSPTGPNLTIFLYYMDVNQALNRVVGIASGSTIQWFAPQTVTGAPALKDTTLMTAISNGNSNFVYYIADGASKFTPYIDPINNEMFKDY